MTQRRSGFIIFNASIWFGIFFNKIGIISFNKSTPSIYSFKTGSSRICFNNIRQASVAFDIGIP